jgi:hypothetical protein
MQFDLILKIFFLKERKSIEVVSIDGFLYWFSLVVLCENGMELTSESCSCFCLWSSGMEMKMMEIDK